MYLIYDEQRVLVAVCASMGIARAYVKRIVEDQMREVRLYNHQGLKPDRLARLYADYEEGLADHLEAAYQIVPRSVFGAQDVDQLQTAPERVPT